MAISFASFEACNRHTVELSYRCKATKVPSLSLRPVMARVVSRRCMAVKAALAGTCNNNGSAACNWHISHLNRAISVASSLNTRLCLWKKRPVIEWGRRRIAVPPRHILLVVVTENIGRAL